MNVHYFKELWKSSLMVLFLCLGLSSWGQATEILNNNLRTQDNIDLWNPISVDFQSAGGGYARFTDLNSSLTTPEFNASAYNSIEVQMSVAKYGSGDDGPITVLYSLDGGVSWNVGGDSSTPSSSTYIGNTLAIDETSSTMVIRFTRTNSPSEKRFRDVIISGIGTGISCQDSNLVFPTATETADLVDGTFTQTATSLNATTAITYTSSDEDVATVNPTTGEVTLVSVGTTTITATQAAGEHNGESYCAATATYELEVITTEPVLTVSTDNVSFTGFAGGAVATETITVEGFNLTGNIALALSGDTNFSIDPNTLSADGGDITITYTPSATPATHSATLTVSNGLLSEVITLSGVTNEMPAIGCFEESFDDITAGNSTSSGGSNSQWNGNDNFPTVVRAYQAGGAVRLGTGSDNGSITSLPLTEYAGHNVVVSFSSKAWGTNASSILISFGTQSQVVNLPAASNWTDGLSDYEVVFENIEPNATLTFETNSTSERRFFLDNIAVCISEVSIDPILNVTSASITGLNYGLGNGPSVSQSFVLSGENLDGSEDVTLLADTGFELSLDDTVFEDDLTLTNYNGAETPIYVRLKAGLAIDTYEGIILIDGYETSAEVNVSGAVLAVPVVTGAIFEGTVGVAFSEQIVATETPTSYAITSGALPDGLSLDTETGIISGTPTTAGDLFEIEVTATNAAGTSTPASFLFDIAKGTQTATLPNLNAYEGDADITLPELTDQGFAIEYISDNEDVATVDGNVLTIVGIGTAEIFAGNEETINYEAFTGGFTITVTEAPITPQPGMLFITEVADASNANNEYLEIYNNTGNAIDMTGSKIKMLSDNTTWVFGNQLATTTIPARGFLILTRNSDQTAFEEDFGLLNANTVLVKGTNGQFFGTATARRWQLLDADDNIIDDTETTVAGSNNRTYQNIFTGIFTTNAMANATPGELEYLVYTAGSWTNGIMADNTSITSDVLIYDEFTLSGDTSVKTLSVANSGAITVPANTSLTVEGKITNNGEFTVESDGILYQNNYTGTNEGNITVKRAANPMKRLDYTLWSSPVSGMLLNQFSNISNNGGTGTIWNRVYELGATAWESVWDSYANATASTETFATAKGYLYRAFNSYDPVETTIFTGEFTGVPNNGEYSINTPNTFDAVGNPYPSPIYADDFITSNSVDAIYFWTNVNSSNGVAYTHNNWASYTTLGGVGVTIGDSGIIDPNSIPADNMHIQPGQGFVVYTEENSVSFDNSMRINSNGQFFRAMNDERSRFWLNLSNEEVTFNQILVGYMDNATQGVDTGIDGKMFAYEGNALYSIIDNNEDMFVIQGRALPFTASDVVALGFRAVNAGSFTISLANLDGLFADNQNIYLKDNFTQSLHNLKEGAYTFVSEEGIFNTRFEVVYQTTMSVENPIANNANWIVYSQENGFQVQTQGFELKTVQVYDLLGRTIYTASAEGTAHHIPSLGADSVYIVKVTTTDNVVLSKKVK